MLKGLLFLSLIINTAFASDFKKELVDRMNAFTNLVLQDRSLSIEVGKISMTVEGLDIEIKSRSERIIVNTSEGNVYTLEKQATLMRSDLTGEKMELSANFYPFSVYSYASADEISGEIEKIDEDTYRASFKEEGYNYALECNFAESSFACDISSDHPDFKGAVTKGVFEGIADEAKVREYVNLISKTCYPQQTGDVVCVDGVEQSFKDEILNSL